MYPPHLEVARAQENASGDFYAEVIDEKECNNCLLPQVEAPCLIGFVNGGSPRRQCFFRRQPRGAEETEQAITAIEMACCERLRYRGTNPEIIARLDGFNCDYA